MFEEAAEGLRGNTAAAGWFVANKLALYQVSSDNYMEENGTSFKGSVTGFFKTCDIYMLFLI